MTRRLVTGEGVVPFVCVCYVCVSGVGVEGLLRVTPPSSTL